MGLEINWAFVLLFSAGLAALSLVGKIIVKHPYNALSYLLNGVLGVIMLFICKELLVYCGIDVPLNAPSIAVSAILGIPGVVATVLTSVIF